MVLSHFRELQFRAPRNNFSFFSLSPSVASGKDIIFLFRQMLESAPLLGRISETPPFKNKFVLLDVIVDRIDPAVGQILPAISFRT